MHWGTLTPVLLYFRVLSNTTERKTDVNKEVMGDFELLSVWILRNYFLGGGVRGVIDVSAIYHSTVKKQRRMSLHGVLRLQTI